MRITLDTNVLIAAFIAEGLCHKLLMQVIRSHRLILSEYILGEFNKNLSEKFQFPRKDVKAAQSLLRKHMLLVEPFKIRPGFLRDATDYPILGTALAGKCRALITGDRELVELKTFRKISILSPREFWKFESENP